MCYMECIIWKVSLGRCSMESVTLKLLSEGVIWKMLYGKGYMKVLYEGYILKVLCGKCYT